RTQPAVTRELATALRAMGDRPRAAEAWEAAYRAAPGRGDSAAEAGLAWLDAGQPLRAVAWLRVAELESPAAARTRELGERLRAGAAPGEPELPGDGASSRDDSERAIHP